MVDSALSNGWVNDNAFSRGKFLDDHLLALNLLGNQWRDVGFETAGSDTHDDETQDEGTH